MYLSTKMGLLRDGRVGLSRSIILFCNFRFLQPDEVRFIGGETQCTFNSTMVWSDSESLNVSLRRDLRPIQFCVRLEEVVFDVKGGVRIPRSVSKTKYLKLRKHQNTTIILKGMQNGKEYRLYIYTYHVISGERTFLVKRTFRKSPTNVADSQTSDRNIQQINYATEAGLMYLKDIGIGIGGFDSDEENREQEEDLTLDYTSDEELF